MLAPLLRSPLASGDNWAAAIPKSKLIELSESTLLTSRRRKLM